MEVPKLPEPIAEPVPAEIAVEVPEISEPVAEPVPVEPSEPAMAQEVRTRPEAREGIQVTESPRAAPVASGRKEGVQGTGNVRPSSSESAAMRTPQTPEDAARVPIRASVSKGLEPLQEGLQLVPPVPDRRKTEPAAGGKSESKPGGLANLKELDRKLAAGERPVEERFRVERAVFDPNIWQLTPGISMALDQLVELMHTYPSLTIELGAHTEAVGQEQINLILSQNRAGIAADYLIREGINSGRIVTKAYGQTMLLNECFEESDCSRAEHLVNQRLEVKVTGL